MEIIIHLNVLFDVLPLLHSHVIAEVVMCLCGTFIVCFSIFLLVSITLVLESKLLIECFHGNLTPLKWLAISQQEQWYGRQKLESITATRQKAVLDVVQEISDDSEIIAQLKEKHLIEREILHCR